ncbi:MAG: DUF222 domain-containing protein [Actinomycetota bacterium]
MAVPASLLASQLPLLADLTVPIDSWSTCQRQVVGLAADFSDSGEWGATGLSSAAHWIAKSADIELCTAREWIRVGKRLRALPAIDDAFAEGVVSYSKVRALTRLATADNEVELLEIASTVPAGQLGRALLALMNRTSGDAELARHQHDQRSVTWRNEPDGMSTFTMRLPPLMAGKLHAALHAFVMSNQPAPLSTEQRPTLAQQHADGVAALFEPGGAEVSIEVVLHVRGDGCTLDDGSPIPGSTVERVAPEAFVRALVHDADGRPINASAKRRHPTARQRRVVKERDRACVNCGATSLLEFDHVPDFAVTGHTVIEELELRCAPCHRRRHAA